MPMVLMSQMTKLMQKHIVLQHLRKTHYIQIQIDVRSGGTAAPVCSVMLDSHAVICKTITHGELRKAWGKFGFRLPAQGLDLICRRDMDILVFLLLSRHRIQDPIPAHLIKGTGSCIRYDVRECHRDTLGRMHLYAYAPAPDAPVEKHIPNLWIGQYFHCIFRHIGYKVIKRNRMSENIDLTLLNTIKKALFNKTASEPLSRCLGKVIFQSQHEVAAV